jgi:hypothetical protein
MAKQPIAIRKLDKSAKIETSLWITVIWSMVASACLTLAMMDLAVW